MPRLFGKDLESESSSKHVQSQNWNRNDVLNLCRLRIVFQTQRVSEPESETSSQPEQYQTRNLKESWTKQVFLYLKSSQKQIPKGRNQQIVITEIMSRLGYGILGRREKMIQQHFIIISLEGTFFPLQQLLCLEVHNRKYKRTKKLCFPKCVCRH